MMPFSTGTFCGAFLFIGEALFLAALNKGSFSVKSYLSLRNIFFFFTFKFLEFAVQEAMIFVDISNYRIQHKLLVYFFG
jgi:hypothetical protein